MPNKTKSALAAAMKEMLAIKPINKITIKDLVESCGVNRQTFYYHFDDVYDLLEWIFEQEAEQVLPKEIAYDRWREDVLTFFTYLATNREFSLNIYNSNSRTYMLRFYQKKLENCVRGFAILVSENMNISRPDFEFVVQTYTNLVIGYISVWLDNGMQATTESMYAKYLKLMDGSVEYMLGKFCNAGR